MKTYKLILFIFLLLIFSNTKSQGNILIPYIDSIKAKKDSFEIKTDSAVFRKDSIDVQVTSNKYFMPNIKVIGHSWAVGTFKGKEEYFRQYGIIIEDTTKIGSSLKWAYERLQEVPENKYDAVCVLSGINDYKSDMNSILRTFSDILELGVQKAPVIFIFNIGNYYKAQDMVRITNEWLQEAAYLNPGVIVLVDIYNAIEKGKENGTFKMRSDGLHPENYKMFQDYFINVVQNFYKEQMKFEPKK